MSLSRRIFSAAFAIWIVLAFFPLRVYCIDHNNIPKNIDPPPLLQPSFLAIDFSTPESAQESNTLLSHYISDFPTLGFRLSTVTVTGNSPTANLTLLTDFISEFSMYSNLLQHLHWSSAHPIPPAILRALAGQETMYIPPPWLHYSVDLQHPDSQTEEDKERDIQSLKNLAYSIALYTLSVRINYGRETNLVDLKLVYNVLRTCENVKRLDLTLKREGGEGGGWAPFAFPFRKIAGKYLHPSVLRLFSSTSEEEREREAFLDSLLWQFPPLGVLKLDGYALQERADGGYAWYWRGWEGYSDAWKKWVSDGEEENEEPAHPVRMRDDGRSNLDVWLKVMDWGELWALELTDRERESLEKLAGKGVLPGLERLVLRGGEGDAALGVLERVGCERGCLEELSLRCVAFSKPQHDISKLISILSIRHPKLKSLSLGSGSQSSLFISPAQLSNITSSFPLLEKLDVDIARPEFKGGYDWDWDWNIFDALLRAREIKDLTLRFPSPDSEFAGYGAIKFEESYSQKRIKYHNEDDETNEVDVVVNKHTLEDLFGEMRRRKREGGGRELERLRVYVGDYDGRYEKGLLPNMMPRVVFWEFSIGKDGREKYEWEQTRAVE